MHPTVLRANIYRVLDRILKTGEPQEIVREGRRLVIAPVPDRHLDLGKLPKREALACSPDDLVETSWEDAWNPD
ncbi:MAG: type II toxin-antitoxin system Phd/YefM family antitoxin [Candidatus Riflebacteria bacterium]|nr:type II toxin-antitoxin system Phd/YefM family antitoxin [Candidatus Riflebacteria bacterium]